jgi:hypothetical protein
LEVLSDLHPAKSVLCLRFGDLGLINGEWPVQGSVPNWNRAEWPMPDFAIIDPLGYRKPMRVRYSDTDPGLFVSETPTTDDHGLGPDSMSGYGAVEVKLTKILGELP